MFQQNNINECTDRHAERHKHNGSFVEECSANILLPKLKNKLLIQLCRK